MVALAPLAGAGEDDMRMSAEAQVVEDYANREIVHLHDPNVQFEEYLYYAAVSRREESILYGGSASMSSDAGPSQSHVSYAVEPAQPLPKSRPLVPVRDPEKEKSVAVETATSASDHGSEQAVQKAIVVDTAAGGSEKPTIVDTSTPAVEKANVIEASTGGPLRSCPTDPDVIKADTDPDAFHVKNEDQIMTIDNGSRGGSSRNIENVVVTDQEWVQASRAARTATWGAVFYLITTDILGPTSVPWAMSQLGYGPGVSLYTVFGALAGYTGYQIWQMFLGLDSDRYPMKNYGDIAYRIYGQWARYTCNILQSLQFFLNVGILIISNGQSISQLSKGSLCFIICLVIFVVAGFSLGQIRTLAKFGYIANIAVWMNLLVIFIT